MTPEERARIVIDQWRDARGIDRAIYWEQHLWSGIVAAITEAVEAERAACAEVARSMIWPDDGHACNDWAGDIAAAIEARKTPPERG